MHSIALNSFQLYRLSFVYIPLISAVSVLIKDLCNLKSIDDCYICPDCQVHGIAQAQINLVTNLWKPTIVGIEQTQLIPSPLSRVP